MQGATTVASGDLGSRTAVHGNEETAQLLRALSRMNDHLAQIVGQVRANSESIAPARHRSPPATRT